METAFPGKENTGRDSKVKTKNVIASVTLFFHFVNSDRCNPGGSDVLLLWKEPIFPCNDRYNRLL